jgi:hypothetical protein
MAICCVFFLLLWWPYERERERERADRTHYDSGRTDTYDRDRNNPIQNEKKALVIATHETGRPVRVWFNIRARSHCRLLVLRYRRAGAGGRERQTEKADRETGKQTERQKETDATERPIQRQIHTGKDTSR